ncbi:MAG: prenyltransferase [Thermodesulfobacteriota bacterium]|nr:prenyltransferase [Thermodesulfobacteriota bacterium]
MTKEKLGAWLRIMRLQFYPMTFIAYSLGAAVAAGQGLSFRLHLYLFGYAYLFLLEVCTIFANELYDLPTDRINRNASPFNGGSRVLVEEKLGPNEVKRALFLLVCLLVPSGLLLALSCPPASRSPAMVLLIAGVPLGLGYTVPPLKLCYRGMGELVVALTHSPYVIACGFVFQSGSWKDPTPWILSVPLFFAVLAAITLAGVPDHRADKRASKNTFSVLFGEKTACLLAVTFAAFAVAAGALLWHFQMLGRSGGLLVLITTPHYIVLLVATFLLIKSGKYDRRIDGIMGIALSYIIWFGIIPLAASLGS